ncbi:MAG TPA: lytic transglycosylase domain-containing protein [Xanthobacteraceae bacterium]|jgi:hypothetical protein|nr:lytic transglycosylase domain-containing protein [Xanthobacteraceae bacterium]
MRSLLALAIVLLCTIDAAPEPEFSSLIAMRFADEGFENPPALLIESSTARGDRLTMAANEQKTNEQNTDVQKPSSFESAFREDRVAVTKDQSRPSIIEDLHPDLMNGRLAVVASADPNFDAAIAADADEAINQPTPISMNDLCDALYTSAESNDLPVPFFANLIWQESRLKADDVSKKGAQGIAQFMPKVAVEKGLADPFDPMQALPASARLLRELRMQFGNLGFVAAAYNAGPRRVMDWLLRRGDLPRETRNYVVRVTGLSVDAWRHIPVDGNALTFVGRLPCRNRPAYADVEQKQSEQTQSVQAKLDELGLDEPADNDATVADDEPVGSIVHKPSSTADRHTQHKHESRKESRVTHRGGHDHRAAKQEAAHRPRGPRDKKAA